MSQSPFWINSAAFADAFRKAGLAEQPAPPPAAPPPVAPPPVAPPPVAPPPVAPPPVAREEKIEVTEVEEPSSEIPEFQDLSDHLQARLTAFLDWIEKQTDAEGIFIVDDEGLVLLERETDPDWVALSSYLMSFHQRLCKSFDVLSSASLAVDISTGGILHWLYAETQLGPHALGIFVRRPIPRKLSKSFQTTLAFVMRQASH